MKVGSRDPVRQQPTLETTESADEKRPASPRPAGFDGRSSFDAHGHSGHHHELLGLKPSPQVVVPRLSTNLPSPAVRLKELPSLTLVEPGSRARLEALAEGTGPLARRAHFAFLRLFADETFTSADPAAQAQRLAELVGKPAFLPPVVSSDLSELVAPESQHTLSAPTRVASYAFSGGKVDADVRHVQLGAHSVPIYSAPTAEGEFQHSVEETARALASLPPELQAKVKAIRLNPVGNPDDGYWARTYNQPGFRAYMTCGADGIVTIYPTSRPTSFEHMADTLAHEVGHAWSDSEWGHDGRGAKWGAWEQAIAADGFRPSKYASSSIKEDVAESTALYVAVHGTPLETEYRRLYPNRFALLDARFGGVR